MLDQGRVIEGHKRVLIISGQASLEEDESARYGVRVKHPGDIRAQFQETLNNVGLVLAEGGMTVNDLIQLRFFVMDMEQAPNCSDIVLGWYGESDNRPPMSFIGVNALFLPGLLVEVEGMAATG